MVMCPKCKSTLPDGSKFCSNCGVRFVQRDKAVNSTTSAVSKAAPSQVKGKTGMLPILLIVFLCIGGIIGYIGIRGVSGLPLFQNDEAQIKAVFDKQMDALRTDDTAGYLECFTEDTRYLGSTPQLKIPHNRSKNIRNLV